MNTFLSILVAAALANFTAATSHSSDLDLIPVEGQGIFEDIVERLKSVENAVPQIEARLANVEKQSIPVGFIYVQLPNQGEPQAIWGVETNWQDISATYAGLFFRTVGEGSATFGIRQEASSPNYRLASYLSTDQIGGYEDNCRNKQCPLNENGLSDYIYTGRAGISDGLSNYIQFEAKTTSAEIRPKNTAVRIWKRTA